MHNRLVLLFLLVSPFSWADVAIVDENCNNKYAAKIVSLQGTLLVDLERKGAWHSARLNELVCEGSGIKVEANSRASLRLVSGVVLRLHEGTNATLDAISTDKPTFIHLFNGFIHFISRTPRLMKISTPIANGGPEGTEFAMRVDDNKASLWVYEGGVKFYNDKGSIFLKSGEGGQTLKGQAPQAKIDIKPQDAVTWALYYPPVLPYPDKNAVIDSELRTAINDYRQGHTDTALARLDGLAATQQTPSFYQARAAMRLTVGQDQLALQDIQRLRNNNPQDVDALALHSILALTQNRKDEAYALATQAIAANPQAASAYSALSYAEQSRFQLDKAQTAANKATELAPHDAMVWARKAELQLSQGLTAESQQAAEKAIALDANLERTQTVLGFSYLLRMDTDAALNTFNKAIEFDSTSPLARLGLGLAKIRNGDLEQGREDLETAAILDPNNAIVRSYLGKAYYEERRSLLAEDQFKLAKERDPKDPTPYFYDAINKQTTNRPVEALQDMQKAIELNDNRGVYRSKFLLDKDTAARQVGLGRIYNNLGFDDPSNREAMKSLALDPSNYSAHRLLSDSYATKPRHEIARSSEYLQSQLLQPLNYNPIQPSLAYTDLNIIKGIGPNDTAFNEYNRLFERNGIRFTTTGIAGSNSTLGDEAALSGIYNKFSLSLGQLYYDTNGFRQNNDLKHNIYNAFAQYEISPEINVQAEYRHRETEHGDLELKGNAFNFNNFSQDFRRRLEQDTYRIGLKASPSKQSDILVSMIHADRNELNHVSTSDTNLKTSSYNLEAQYLFRNDFINTVLGGGAFNTDNILNITCKDSQDANCISGASDYKTNQYFGYFYSTLNVLKKLKITSGLSYDYYRDNDKTNGAKVSEINPKLGFIWQANKYLSFRAAGFKSVKSAIVDNQVLQPTQISGFNQFFDDFNGTAAWQYGVGMDMHFFEKVYAGVEAYNRDLKIPNGTEARQKTREEFYRFYFNWIPTDYLSVNSEFRFEYFRYSPNESFDPSNPFNLAALPTYPNSVETFYIPLELRFFDPSGFFATLKGTYVNQKMNNSTLFFIDPDTGARVRIEDSFGGSDFKSDFYLVDAAIGYRFPKQFGLISFEVKNLFDTHFDIRDRRFQMNEQRSYEFVPERMLFGRITLNF